MWKIEMSNAWIIILIETFIRLQVFENIIIIGPWIIYQTWTICQTF
jgi:hypothetical protein